MVIIYGYMDYFVLEISQDVSQEVVFWPCSIFDELTFDVEEQIQGVKIKGFHTDNVVLYN